MLAGEEDILGFCETFLSDKFLDSQLIWDSQFSIFRRDRVGRTGGGVALFIRTNLSPAPVSVPSGLEIVACEIKTKTNIIRVISAYRPPNANFNYTTDFCDCLSRLCDISHPIILVGDFNYPTLRGCLNTHALVNLDRASEAFLTTIHSLSLNQINTHSSREQNDNLLDLIFVSNNLTDACSNVDLLEPFCGSDHNGLSFSISVSLDHKSQTKKFYNFRKANHNEAKIYLHSVDWDLILSSCPDVESFSGHLYYHLDYAIRNFVPQVRSHPPASLPPPLLRLRRKMRAKFHRRHNDRAAFLRARKRFHQALRDFHSQEEETLLRAPTLKQFYSLVRNKLKGKPASLTLHGRDGELITDPPSIAAAFAAHFSAVYTVDNGVSPPVADWQGQRFDFTSVSEGHVLSTLKLMQPKLSCGPDGVPTHFLKGVASSLARPLSLLFSWCLATGENPRVWKQAYVKPLYKNKGERTNPNNYRPISKACSIAKLLEKIISKQCMAHLSKHNLLSPLQFGFRPDRSTVSQLLNCVSDWTRLISNKETGFVVYLDFMKAFDSVSHSKLLTALSSKGLGPVLLRWFESYLRDRSQCVEIDEYISPPAAVTSGTMQGGCIGPTAFLCFIDSCLNILSKHENIKYYAFADDIKIYSNNLKYLQDALDEVSEWCGVWQLRLSVDKCHTLVLGREGSGLAPASSPPEDTNKYKPPPANLVPLILMGHPLRFVGSARDLGVEVDSTLSFRNHCRAISKSSKRAAFQTLRCFQAGRVEPLLRAYKLYIRPKIEYASVVYSPVNVSDSKIVESVQRYYTRALFAKCRLRPLPYERRLSFLKLDSLASRRLKLDLSFAHKLYHKVFPDCNILTFSSSTRSHRNNAHLLKEASGLRERLHFFSNRIVHTWNRIPEEIINGSHDKFKEYIDLK